jgi:hypothetical protein
VDAELLEEVLDVRRDRPGADHEPLGDLRLGQAQGKKPQHLCFARRELRADHRRRIRGRSSD